MGFMGGVIAIWGFVGFPAFWQSDSFAPGEREYLHKTIREVVDEGMQSTNDNKVAIGEYEQICSALQEKSWDSELVRSPDNSEESWRLARSLYYLELVFGNVQRLQEEQNLASYSFEKFCEDIWSSR